jgi:hypothetical protein
MKKDLIYTLGYLLLLPVMLLYWFATRDRLDTTAIFLMTGWMYILVIGSVMSVEMNEMKNGGYRFLATLPLCPREIAGGKFLPVLLHAALYSIVAYIAFSSLGARHAWLGFARSWLLANTALVLALAGLIYWVLFRFGFMQAMYMMAAAFILAFPLPIVLNELLIRGHIAESSSIFRLAGATGGGSMIAAGLAVFLAFYYLSVRALEGGIRT